jgi:hypothetical protein
MRVMAMLVPGALLLQAAGCNVAFLDFVQTVLLGITAAGAVAIIQNI